LQCAFTSTWRNAMVALGGAVDRYDPALSGPLQAATMNAKTTSVNRANERQFMPNIM
jgi:hypothetical protein